MAANGVDRPKTSKPKAPVNQKTLKRKRGDDNTKSLQQRVASLDVAADFTSFSDLPLSEPTLRGLEGSHFKTLTDIQGKAIPAAIKGQDILGAARTGSGKTLAFIVPVLEILYRKRWTEFDGLGALVLSPTRELAIQIFDVLRKVGRHHAFSAGLVIGGKSLKEERERLGKMNILICTPGRMLQHLDQTADLQIENLAVLVLDEADRIMDMGFKSTVDAIVEHLPRTRQTLLFSATQTKKVSDLARLSLQDPYYVSVHETASTATPAKLQQNYIVTPLPEKLDTLWSFIRANTKSKILVFLSSGKQVRFVFETFRHLQPGIPLMHLHGRQKQTARLDITSKFGKTKNACLLATDVVARGLDFAAVDWVIQLDCPEDSDTYIHRVGRTARFEREGRAVLFLCPSEEEGMLKRLKQKNVPIEMIKVKANKQQTISNQLQNMCFQDPEIKYLAQKAFVSYARSIYVQKDKDVFRLSALPLEEFAASIGLPGAPRIKFQQGEDVKKFKNAPRFLDLSSSEDEEAARKAEKPRTKYDRMFERRNQNILSNHYSKLMEDGSAQPNGTADDADEDNDFLSVKQRLDLSSADEASSSDEDVPEPQADGQGRNGNHEDSRVVIDSNRKQKMLRSKKAMLKFKDRNHKIVYDSDGNAHEVYELEDEDDFKRRGTAADQRAQFIESEALRVKEADLDDKETVKTKRREKQEKRRARERELASNLEGDEEDEGVTLEPYLETLSDDDASMDGRGAGTAETRKWFQHDPNMEDARRQKKRKPMLEDVGTLEELENLAGQLI